MNREGAFSLTIMIIIMAFLAIFIGYLLGNWLIQYVTGPSDQQLVDQRLTDEEIIGDDDQSTPAEDIPSLADNLSTSDESDLDFDSSQTMSQVYVVQVGAFNHYINAVALKDELQEQGIQVVINDDQLPYKVQLGATNNREEAEKTREDIKELGYDAFIAH